MNCYHLVEEVRLSRSLDAYRHGFDHAAPAFLFDGGGSSTLAQYTLFGAEPFLTFRATRASTRNAAGRLGARISVETNGERVESDVDDPFVVLRSLLAEHAAPPSVLADCPLPLRAGAVGYVGYEVGQMLERMPCTPRPSLGMPDMFFSFHAWVIGRCRRTERTWLSVVGRGRNAAEGRRDAEHLRERVLATLAACEREPLPASSRATSSTEARNIDDLVTASRAVPSVSRDTYLARVGEARAHILRGNAFEICLTHAWQAPYAASAWDLFRELRKKNAAPFAAILDLPEGAIVSSSPERFVTLDAHRMAESRPIKGTRPRSADPRQDDALATELASSEKDRAENAMIVDLVRNDFGRVCRFGTVTAPDLHRVERYATVHQLVSTVRGELAPEHDALDLLRACFPPGSMTGAPKIEATSLLEGLEPTERGVYSGGLGYIDVSGTMDLSVVIRTVVVKSGTAHFSVGGAVVADSIPESEYDETMHKARALLEAIADTAAPKEPS